VVGWFFVINLFPLGGHQLFYSFVCLNLFSRHGHLVLATSYVAMEMDLVTIVEVFL
jgi:hypothetical protein